MTSYAARPPSERAKEPEMRRGIGVFRYAGCGWGATLALFLFVGVIVLIGYLRDDPGRNPAPEAYRTAVCAASAELSNGTQALERGIESGEDAAAIEVEQHVAAANDALTDLPAWEPGRALDELLGSQIITLSNGAGSLESGPVEEDLEIARDVDADIRTRLEDGRYGFECSG